MIMSGVVGEVGYNYSIITIKDDDPENVADHDSLD